MNTKNTTTICLDFCKESDTQLSITTNNKSITVGELKNQVMRLFEICNPKLMENPTSIEITRYNDFVKLWNNERKAESSEFLMKSFDCPKALAQTVKELNAARDKLQKTETQLEDTKNSLIETKSELKRTVSKMSLIEKILAEKLNIHLEDLKN